MIGTWSEGCVASGMGRRLERVDELQPLRLVEQGVNAHVARRRHARLASRQLLAVEGERVERMCRRVASEEGHGVGDAAKLLEAWPS